VLASAIVTATASFAQDRGNADAGRRLAENWCGKCHVVAPRTIRSGDTASSFQAIADLESTTALSLRVFLRTSHQEMPNFQLTPEETNDIIAYVLSLKKR
jgi:mono/diheme cytochrome c family protein